MARQANRQDLPRVFHAALAVDPKFGARAEKTWRSVKWLPGHRPAMNHFQQLLQNTPSDPLADLEFVAGNYPAAASH